MQMARDQHKAPSPIHKQATINIGVIGHVANGKSTVVRQLTGTTTGQHSSDKKRNCTIHLGYANCKIYQCTRCNEYNHGPSSSAEHPCKHCGAHCELIRHVSFVDCPGHDQLISTMINGAAVMDGALLVTAANEPCPQDQTVEHLMATELLGVEHYVKVQNKVDLVPDKTALHKHATALQALTAGTHAQDAPLIPLVAQTGRNMDALVEAIATQFPLPSHDLSAPLRMSVIRTFKVSTPGMPPHNLRGGVLGGSITAGLAKVGDMLEIRPGLSSTAADGSKVITPLFTRVQSLRCDTSQLDYAVPGGLVGVQTDLDPFLCMSDRLVGQVAGSPGTLPPVLSHVALSLQNIKRVGDDNCEFKLVKNLQLMLHVGTAEVSAVVTKVDKRGTVFRLNAPVCCDMGTLVTVFENKRLVAYGKTVGGKEVPLPEPPCLDQLANAPNLRPPVKQKGSTNKPATKSSSMPKPSKQSVELQPETVSSVHEALFAGKKKKAKSRGIDETSQECTAPPAGAHVKEVGFTVQPTEHSNAPAFAPAEESPAELSSTNKSKSKKKSKSKFEIAVEEPEAEPEVEILPFNEPSADQVDTAVLARSCRFYEQKLPVTRDIVTVMVERIGDHGVHVSLPEYCSTAGFIPLSELTRKNRVRNVKALACPGREMVCEVTSVDLATGHIDLTKGRVAKQDTIDHQAKYSEAQLAHQVLCRAAALCSCEDAPHVLEQLYNTIAWPMAIEHDGVYNGLLAAIADPATTASKLEPAADPAQFETVLAEAMRRMTPRARRCCALVRMNCTGPLGVHAVRSALCTAQDGFAEGVSLRVDVPPVYRLCYEGRLVVAARELWQAVRLLQTSAAKFGATFQIESSPHAVAGDSAMVLLDEPESFAALGSADDLASADGGGFHLPNGMCVNTISEAGARATAPSPDSPQAPFSPATDIELIDDGQPEAPDAAERASIVLEEVALLLDTSEQLQSELVLEEEEEVTVDSVTENNDDWQQRYTELLEVAFDETNSHRPKLRLSTLQILMKSKQTLIANFGAICHQVRRPVQHVMLFLTTELGTSGSIKGDGCGLVLRGRFKPSQIEVLIRRYCIQFVKCTSCGAMATDMSYDSSIRSHAASCRHCQASRTLVHIRAATYQAQIGRRKR